MRLPIIDGDPAKIDQPTAIRMIRYAIDHGVNYVDTAYRYHRGTSETLVGKSLQDGYREKVRLATKMPTWLVNSQQDMDKYLDKQLARLQTDHIDFYLLHGLNKDRWPKVKQLGVIGWAEKKMEEGKIGRLGFSFHDEYSVFKEIIDSYEGWVFCQIQFNYTDADYQAGTGTEIRSLQGPSSCCDGTHSRREVGCQAAKRGPSDLGQSKYREYSSEAGSSMGLESSGGVGCSQRYEHFGTGYGEP